MVEQASREPRYRAFLSYSHLDASPARRLHRRLETYRLPRRLVGHETASGPAPGRLCPIFRDREELAASADLTETVRSALAESAALIVLCSPHAAASLWVSEEIRTFRSLYPDRPILAAILSGDPPHCFPAALRVFDSSGAEREPLATDLRPEGDGPHLGLLKLIAGLTGVGLDDLVQRDAQRRIRRVTTVTGIAATAMLVMAALLLFALQARREAERQRAEAEGLIEFMLTDLRDTLRGVGRLDALGAVNSRALDYYDQQGDLARLPDESLARRARILHAIGDDALARHDFDEALSVFGAAHRATAELATRAPDDSRRIFEHSKSEAGLGRVYEMRRDWSRAQEHYLAFAAAADRLVAMDPASADYLTKAASGAVDLGNIQLNGTRDYPAAEQSYRRAVELFDRAARARPDDLHVALARANAYGWLADSYFVQRDWSGSLNARRRQFEIMDGLQRRQPDNAEIAFRLAAARRGLAHSQLRIGDRQAARASFFEAYSSVDRLGRLDSANNEWRLLKRLLSADILQLGLGSPAGVTPGRLRLDSAAHHDESHAIH